MTVDAKLPPAAPPSLEATYVHLHDDRSASLVPLTPTFWPEVVSGQRPDLLPGRLAMVFSFTSAINTRGSRELWC